MFQRTARICVVLALSLSIGRWAAHPAQAGKPPQGGVSQASRAATVTAARRVALSESYGIHPLAFEPNQGQTDRRVRFLSRGPGYDLFLTSGEAVLSLREKTISSTQVTTAGLRSGSVLRIKLDGANRSPTLAGFDPLPGKANYFIGKDPRKWRTNVPTYARVKYHNVCPGL